MNEMHTDNTETLYNALEKIKKLERENTELKDEIEKMKRCGNCVHFDFTEPNYCHKGVYREHQYVCGKWNFGN